MCVQKIQDSSDEYTVCILALITIPDSQRYPCNLYLIIGKKFDLLGLEAFNFHNHKSTLQCGERKSLL